MGRTDLFAARLACIGAARSRDVAVTMSPLRPRPARPDNVRAPRGELRWSLGLLLILAAAWSFEGLAFFFSARFEGSDEPWVSDAIWRSTVTFTWFAFSPLIFFLTKAFPVRGEHAVRNAAAQVLAAFGLGAAHMAIILPVNSWLDPSFKHQFGPLEVALRTQAPYRILTGMITYGVVFFAFAAIDYDRKARAEEHRSEELARRLAEAQLQALRMQIQPHFLFNTLHSISSLIYESPSEALTMVSRLGDFLRASLDRGAAPTIRFEDELRFAELYLAIEKVRFADRLRVTLSIAPEVADVQTPTLILQPLVENAIRHGVAPALGPVELALEAAERDGGIEIRLRNRELAARAANADASAPIEGLGLANTRARLAQAYGGRATLTCEATTPGCFEVTVRMPRQDERDVD
jgi:hypothetical protein